MSTPNAAPEAGKRGRKSRLDVAQPKETNPVIAEAIKSGNLSVETKAAKLSAEKAEDKKEHTGSYKIFVAKNSQGALALCGGKNETLVAVVMEYFNSKSRNAEMTRLRNEAEGPEKAVNSAAKRVADAGLRSHAIKLITEALGKTEAEANAHLDALLAA